MQPTKTPMPVRIWDACKPWLFASQSGTLHGSSLSGCEGVASTSDAVEELGVRLACLSLATTRRNW